MTRSDVLAGYCFAHDRFCGFLGLIDRSDCLDAVTWRRVSEPRQRPMIVEHRTTGEQRHIRGRAG